MTQEIQMELFKIAAGLVRKSMSYFRDDYPKSMPVSVLRDIQKQNDYLRECAYRLGQIAKGVKP
jgi:hypothetical protein